MKKWIWLWPWLLMLIVFSVYNAWLPSGDDVKIYHNYSQKILSGQLPYQDFKVEYPPFALAFMLVPALLSIGGDFTLYELIFHAQTIGLAAFSWWLIQKVLIRLGYPDLSSRWYAISGWLLSLYICQRFDIGVAFLTSLALYAICYQRPFLAGLSLGFGVAAKLYPAILFPVTSLFYWQTTNLRPVLRHLVGFASGVMLPCVFFIFVTFNGLFEFLQYHTLRPIQTESVAASFLMIGYWLGLADVTTLFSYGSYNLISSWNGVLISGCTVLLVLGLGSLYLWWAYNKNKQVQPYKLLIVLWSLSILWFVLTSKVLSPQYLIWLMPFVAFWTRPAQIVFVSAAFFSQFQLLLTDEVAALSALPYAIFAFRNVLLIVLAIILLKELHAQSAKIS